MPVKTQAQVKEIVQRTYNVKSFRVGIADLAPYKAGQFLAVSLDKDDTGLKRYLSISSSPTEKGYLEFTKKLTESQFSRHLGALSPGDSLGIEYPFGKFTLLDPGEKIAFISGGIGITPIRSIAKFVVDSKTGTDMALLYANRTEKDIVFRQDFEEMQKASPSFKVSHILSEPEAGFNGICGRINTKIIKDEVADYERRRFFLCGPPAMVEAMRNILVQELNLGQERIVTENFQGY